MDTRTRSTRVLMLPWLAHGHISPFLEFAKALAKRNFIIYVVSSPVNLAPIRQKLTKKDSISINLVDLYIPPSSELPPEKHTTNGLPPHLMPALKTAFDNSRSSFSNLLKSLKPDLVIYDFLHPFAPEEAAPRNIPAVLFLSPGAGSCSYFMHHWFNEPEVEYPYPAIYLRESEYGKYDSMVEPKDGSMCDSDRVRGCVNRSCEIVLIKTFREFEGKYIDHLSSMWQKKFVPVGPLVQNVETANDENSDVIKWLDRKDKASTVYLSFGSEYFLNEKEMEEIALGLEMVAVNFIWVIRFPDGEKKKAEEALPEGFLERVGDRGLMVEGWAPQGRILSHAAVGAFVSHCGWSSVMEGIHHCVPIIAVPMHLDQPLNARVVQEMGIGEEAVRNEEGILERDEVANVIEKVVLGEVGAKLRSRMRELSGKAVEREGEDMDRVEEVLVRLCRRNERWPLLPNSSVKMGFLGVNREDGMAIDQNG